MDDFISRQMAIDAILEDKNDSKILEIMRVLGEGLQAQTHNGACDRHAQIIKALPSAQERKKGKWIKKMRVTETEKYISYDPEWYCACCGTKYDPHVAKTVNFCYVCGVDMRGEQDEAD